MDSGSQRVMSTKKTMNTQNVRVGALAKKTSSKAETKFRLDLWAVSLPQEKAFLVEHVRNRSLALTAHLAELLGEFAHYPGVKCGNEELMAKADEEAKLLFD